MRSSGSYLARIDVALFSLGLVVRLISARTSPISDCDEVFNYWEAVHFSLYQKGLQTWEYAPEYALRSWFYVFLASLPIRLFGGWISDDRIAQFYLTKAWYAVVACLGEVWFVGGVRARFGPVASRIAHSLLIFSSGPYRASVELLPSTTALFCGTLAWGSWLRGDFRTALYLGSFSVLQAWPFSAILFIVVGLDALLSKGVVFVCQIAVIASFTLALMPSLAFDYPVYVGLAETVPVYNILVYNLGGDGSKSELYGVEKWDFYLRNLLLNFNFAFPLSLAGCAIVFYEDARRGFELLRVGALSDKDASASSSSWRTPLTALAATSKFKYLLPYLVALVLFTVLSPHKEERFVVMAYFLVCLAAAVACARVETLALRRVLVVSCVVCALSRSYGQAAYFGSVNDLYSKVSRMKNVSSVCVGEEWHRFPSSFFLSEKSELKFVRSSFKGLLPAPFAKSYPSNPKHAFNSENRVEDDRYVVDTLAECDVLVSSTLHPDELDMYAPSRKSLVCVPFLDAANTPLPERAFYVGPSPRLAWAEYCAYSMG